MVSSKRHGAQQNHDGKTIGVGIIGCGGWANRQTPACKANPHAKIVGLADIKETAAESLARTHDIDAPIFSDYRELLAIKGLDAVIIMTPNNVHAPIAIAAAKAGKHVLCEKPMATKLSDAEAMVTAVKKAGVVSMTGYTKRFFRGTRFLYDLFRSEDFGRVYHIRAFYFQSWLSDPNTPIVWRLQRNITGTGVLGDLGAHMIDLVQYLVGDDITKVTGMMKTFINQRRSAVDPGKDENVDVDDAVMFGAEFKNGAMGVFQSSRNATGRPDHWRIEIDAQNGALIYDNLEQHIQMNLRKGPARFGGWIQVQFPVRYGENAALISRSAAPFNWSADFEMRLASHNEINHFIQCAQSGQTPAPSFVDGLKTERVIDAVVRSSSTGKAVDLAV
jgi:predicted dehydrogenase